MWSHLAVDDEVLVGEVLAPVLGLLHEELVDVAPRVLRVKSAPKIKEKKCLKDSQNKN